MTSTRWTRWWWPDRDKAYRDAAQPTWRLVTRSVASVCWTVFAAARLSAGLWDHDWPKITSGVMFLVSGVILLGKAVEVWGHGPDAPTGYAADAVRVGGDGYRC